MRKYIIGFFVCLILTAVGCGVKEVPPDSMTGNNDGKEIPVTDAAKQPFADDSVSHKPLNVSLEIENKVYFMDEEAIPFQVINSSDEVIASALIPELEKWTNVGWIPVDCIAGFCGTKDQVKEINDGSVLLEWYPGLEPGHYRICVSVSAPDGKVMVSDTFILLKDESFLPAEGEAFVTMDAAVDYSKEDGITVNYVLTNLSSKEGFFGLDFLIEKFEGDEWVLVPMVDGVGWNSIGLILPEVGFCTMTIDTGFYYEELNQGQYRLVKTVYMDGESINLMAEFEL